jgi:hypothetical protein
MSPHEFQLQKTGTKKATTTSTQHECKAKGLHAAAAAAAQQEISGSVQPENDRNPRAALPRIKRHLPPAKPAVVVP